jgi:large repetitive protein
VTETFSNKCFGFVTEIYEQPVERSGTELSMYTSIVKAWGTAQQTYSAIKRSVYRVFQGVLPGKGHEYCAHAPSLLSTGKTQRLCNLGASVFLAALPVLGHAQSSLELTSSSASTASIAPTTTFTAQLQRNTNNPTGNTFNAPDVAVSVTVRLLNQQYTMPASENPLGIGMAIGGATSGVGFINGPAFGPISGIGAPANGMLTSIGTVTAGTGMDTTVNHGVRVFTSARALSNAAVPTLGRYYMGDIEVEFSKPIPNPVIHLTGLGGSNQTTLTQGASTATMTTGFTTEFDYDAANSAGVASIARLSGSSSFTLSGVQINNSTTIPNASCATNVGACGSIIANGNAVTRVRLRTYLRGDGGVLSNPGNIAPPPTSSWSSATGHAGDAWYLSVSSIVADMTPVYANLPALVSPGSTYSGLTLTCSNAGPNPATTAICAPSVDAGTISNLVCTPASPAASVSEVIPNNRIVCTFNYTAPGTAGGSDVAQTGVVFTGQTGASNDGNGGALGTAGNNQITATAAVSDAVDDADSKPAGAAGQTTNVAANDQVPVGSSYAIQSGGTCAGANVSAVGVATYTVPASGSCTVNYQVCAPAPNTTVCDTATLTITASGALPTFSCNSTGLLQEIAGQLNRTNVNTSPFTFTPLGTQSTFRPNAMGYLNQDGFLYAIQQTGVNQALRIDANGVVSPLGAIAGVPSGNYNTGDINQADGYLYFAAATDPGPLTIYVSDVTASPPTLIRTISAPNGAVGNDFAFTADGSAAYTVRSSGQLVRLELSGSTLVATPVGPSHPGGWGSVYFDANNNFYAYRSDNGAGNGELYVFDIATGNKTLLGAGPIASGNDGASCPSAPPPVFQADMTAAVAGFPTIAAAGSTVTGTVSCTNNGPSAAVTPTCTPTGAPAGATVTCAPNPLPSSLPVGGTITCNVSYTAPATGNVTITGTAGTSSQDPVAGNNTAQASTTFTPTADMAAVTTVPATVNAGQSITVSGTCTNNGPSPAAAPACALSGLPAGATQSCTPAPVPDPLAVGAGITCSSTFVAPASGTLNITTTAGTSTTDPVANNNTDIDPLTITPQADMQVSISGIPSNPPAGSTVNGTVTCTNNGPSPAAAPTCNVTGLPAGSIVTCTPNPAPNPLAVGSSISCAVSYTVPATGAVTVTGTAGSTTPDPNTANNTAQISATVSQQADMQAVTAVPATVNAGQSVTAAGTCTNNGPSPAAAPTCVLSGLPAGATQTCTPNPVPNPLPVGSSITCTSTFTAPATGSLNIVTTAGSSTADPVPANNVDPEPVSVTPQADMAAAVNGFPATANAGNTVTGTVTCANNGPSIANNATCAVSGIPAGALVVCTPAVPAASLAVGAPISCSVSYAAPASGTVTATVTAGSSTADPVSGNNTASAATNVTPQADMQAVTTLPTSANAGQAVTVSGVCTNAGPSAAASPTCALSGLPAGATQTCTSNPAPNPLAVGQSITCTSTFNAPATGALSITTTAGSSTADPNPNNNVDTDPLAVTPQSDMQAAVSGFPTSANAGDTVTGTVTCTNNGPSPAPNATCAVSAIPAAGVTVACTPDPAPNPLPVGGVITCNVSYVAPSNGAPLTITGVAGSANADPVPANNTAQDAVNTVPQADVVATTTVPASANAGQPVTVTGTCVNNGPSAAAAPTCALSGLPPGATQTCTPNPIPDPQVTGAGATVTCTSTFTAPATGPLNITTTAGTTTSDPAPANNVDTSPVTVVLQADMAAALSDFPSNPPAGSAVNGTVTCTNNGPSIAAGATCDVTGAPAGASIVCSPATPAVSLGGGSTITCSVSYVAPAGGGAVNITGTAGSTTADPNPANNVVSTTSNVVPQADMQATNSGFPSNPPAGSTVTGTVTCTNAGPSVAAAANCAVTGLPPGATVNCTPNPAPNPLAVGGTINCAVTYTAPATGTVTVLGAASTTTADPVTGNNQTTLALPVNPQADMVAAISGFPTNTSVGSPVTGTITCTNNGPSPAAGATCNVGGTPPGATINCVPNPAPNPLAVGQSITCTVSYTATANGAVNITGRAGSTTADPNPGNNTVSAATGVIDAVNDTAPTPVNGASGGVGIANVLVNDTLNGGSVSLANITLAPTATTNPGVTLDPATGAVNVALGTPAGTYVVTYQICTRTTPAACDTATATATVNSPPIDAVDDPQAVAGPAGISVNLLGNDTLNGQPAQAAAVTPTLVNNGGINGLTIDASGNLAVPPNTPPGVYTVTYQICEKLNPTNCDTATVPVVVQGSLTGSVWLDASSDRQRGGNEAGLAGWTVEAVYPPGHPQAGNVATVAGGAPATATTDANGQYQLQGLPPGNYQLRFRAPAAAGSSGPVYGTPANGENGNPQPGSTVNTAARVLDIQMPAGAGLSQQSLPVDPSGVVYDSATRQPVVGASVRLIGPNRQPVPADQLLPGQQDQTVIASGPAAGTYRFDLLPGAPAGNYTIEVTPPAGFAASQLIPPNPGPVTPGSGSLCPGATAGTPCPVQPQSTAPAVGASTTYYLSFTLTPGVSPDVVHNHIALDPANAATLAIVKLADKSEAEIGDPVKYTIRVKNLAVTGTLPVVTVVDTLPLGFKYVAKTARSQSNPPLPLAEPTGAPGPQLTFNIGALNAGAETTFTYYVRIGIGGADGDGINRAQAQAGVVRSLVAQAKVKVRGGVLGEDACVVGKVFVDCAANGVGYGNGNGIQDAGEPGIPGVRLYMQDGSYVITDSEGKYSLCGLPPRTHVLKADPVTLPKGARLGTTSNRNAGDPGSLFVDLKSGQLQRADFRDMSCNASVFDEVKRRKDAAPPGQQEDVNRAGVQGSSQAGSGLGLPAANPGNSTGSTPVNQGGKQ